MTNKESPYIANHNEKVTARVRHLPRAHTTTWRDELASAIGEAKGEARQEQCGHALSSELGSGPIGTPGRSASVPEFGRRSRLSLGRGKRLARAERLGVGMPMAFVALSCCTPSENRVDGVWFAGVAQDISRVPGHRLKRWVTVAGIKERGTSTMADDVACWAG